jgi:hypothetical protein
MAYFANQAQVEADKQLQENLKMQMASEAQAN